MDKMRLILAVLAAVLAVIFAAVWYVKGRQHSLRGRGAALFYASLLFVSALVLVIKSRSIDPGSSETITPVRPEVTQSPTNVEPQQSEARSSDPATSDKESTKQDPVATWTKAKIKTPPATRRGIVAQNRRLAVQNNSSLPTVSRTTNEEPIENVIEANVLQAFDFIEDFFETYGAPSSSSIAIASKPSAASIEFVSGSALLSQQSITYLRKLAAEFERRYDSGRLEIRAQTNESVSSPSERLLLTQSRAEAVRNVLAEEGFPSDRMVPVGTDSAGETQVKFVHRPN